MTGKLGTLPVFLTTVAAPLLRGSYRHAHSRIACVICDGMFD